MFEKFIKNKALCFLLSVASVCPFVHAKDASKLSGNEIADDVLLRQESSQSISSPQTVSRQISTQTNPEDDWEECYETQVLCCSSEYNQPLDEYTETLVMDDGTPFFVLSSEKEAPQKKCEQQPLSTLKTQTLNVEGTPLLILDEEKKAPSKTQQQELAELLEIPADVSQPSMTNVSLDKEAIQEEMKKLLERLNPEKVAPLPQQSDLEEALTLSEESTENATVNTEIKLPSTEEVKTEEEVKETPVAEKEPTLIEATQPIHSNDSLVAFQELNSAIEGKTQDSHPQKTEVKPAPFSTQPRPRTSEEKEAMYVLGGIASICLLLAIGEIFSAGYQDRAYKKRKRFRAFEGDYDQFLEEIYDSVQTASKKNQDSAENTQNPVENDQKSESETKTYAPSVISAVSEPSTDSGFRAENFSEVFAKERHDLAEWVWAAKSLEEIKKERAILRRKMALAKKNDDDDEKDRIKARREVLNAKRREACLRANSKEMQAIKERRRSLTRQMTRAKRHDNKQLQEKIQHARSALWKKVK